MEGTTPNSKGLNTALKVITTCFHSDFEFFPFITLVFLRLYLNNSVSVERLSTDKWPTEISRVYMFTLVKF